MPAPRRDVSLKPFNTFGLDARAAFYVKATSTDEVTDALAFATQNRLPVFVLGGGSNTIFAADFPGLVLHVALLGRSIDAADGGAVVTLAAGEDWHPCVSWSLDQGLSGIENLALIPGTAGAAPIQNIGAYGIEIRERLMDVRAIDRQTLRPVTLDNAACQFAYRDSLFKRTDADRYVITAIRLRLLRKPDVRTTYADVANELAARGVTSPSPRDVFNAVVAIRTRKLPDWRTLGNAGSFFKNPVVPHAQWQALSREYADLPSYPAEAGQRKLAAGWLIDRCGLKGLAKGGASVFEKQALVLVNRGNATARDVLDLAAEVQARVTARFGVALEPEPVIVCG